MEAEAKYTYVGATVLALIAALVASVIWLKRTGAERDFARYTIYFEEQALDGLAVGADVNMRGISIGRVLDYQLSKDRLNRARVDVRIDRRAPVRENTVAVITRNFVTGIAQVRLVNSEPAGGPLTQVPGGERFPVIAEGRSDLSEISGRVTELGQLAGQALTSLNEMLTAENREAFAEMLGNLRNLSRDLDRRLAGIERTLVEIGGAAREFRRASAQVGAAAGTTFAETQTLIVELRALVAETQRTAAKTTETMNLLQTDASRAARAVTGTATQLDDQLLVAVGELRASLDTMQRSLERISDPRAALLGPDRSRLGPGETLP